MADTTLYFTSPDFKNPAPTGSNGMHGSPGGGNGGPGATGGDGQPGLPGPICTWTVQDAVGKLIIYAQGGAGQDGGTGGRGGDAYPPGQGGRGGPGGRGGDGGPPAQVVIYIGGKLPPIEINTGNSMPGKKGIGGDPGSGNGDLGRGADGAPGTEGANSTVTIKRVHSI